MPRSDQMCQERRGCMTYALDCLPLKIFYIVCSFTDLFVCFVIVKILRSLRISATINWWFLSYLILRKIRGFRLFASTGKQKKYNHDKH